MKPYRYFLATNKTGVKRCCVSLLTIGLLAINMVPKAKASSDMLTLIDGSRVVQYASQVDVSVLQGDVSIIEQQGKNNQASVIQSRSASYQLANFSHIYQYGNNNLANVSQANGNNVGVVWQVGDNHTANITQQGNSLSLRADIYQLGFSGDVSISQSGSGLRGVSVQQQNYSGNARPVTIDTY